MIQPLPFRRALAALPAGCPLASAGRVAKATSAIGVGRIEDRPIGRSNVCEADCDHAAGTWDVRPLQGAPSTGHVATGLFKPSEDRAS